jgi:hypothetical protein
VRRIDQRRDEDCGWPFAAMISQHGWADTGGDRHCGAWPRPAGPLVGHQSVQRRTGGFRVLLTDATYHFEKKRERPWRAFMLRCTLVR